ncbi:M23 family metallopeptidase [Ferrimonas balearica]|uniref:M23 family metallopeptidase n=1 Tax=Ferrimonas balearica TaxID=44012 RepID=UPI001C99E10C|nr:M23 family metallopeptidase [Ferrimonas balearica]MBY5991290.1 M23 family metallopeptidase [Ferrimonas balearica]
MVRQLWLSSLFIISFFTYSQEGLASRVALEGDLTQGSLLRGQTDPGTQVWLNGQPLPSTTDGHFVMGFGRDAALEHTLTLHFADGEKLDYPVVLAEREYKIQRIEGIARRIMEPNPEDVARAQEDARQTRAARERFETRTDWQQAFIWPLHGRITGVYGSQRFYNGEPRNPHFGVDVAAPTGTPVVAPADGVITLAVPDMFYSGGTLIIDHGFGVSSTFIHLHKLLVEPGTEVKQGEVVAEVGATGRVTGPHLDWRLNWHQERLDPALLVGPMPKGN